MDTGMNGSRARLRQDQLHIDAFISSIPMAASSCISPRRSHSVRLSMGRVLVLAVWTALVSSALVLRVDAASAASPTVAPSAWTPWTSPPPAQAAAAVSSASAAPSPTEKVQPLSANVNVTCDAHYQTWNATTQQCDCKRGFSGLGCQMCSKIIDCQRAFHDDHGGAEYACVSGLVYRNESAFKTYDCMLDASLQALFSDGAMAVHCDRASRNCTASVFKKHNTWRGEHVIDCTLSQCDFANGGHGDGKCGLIMCKCGKSCSAFTKAIVETSLSGKPAKFTISNVTNLAIEIEGSPVPLAATCQASACERQPSGGSGSDSGSGGGDSGGGDSIWSNMLFVALVASGSLVLVILLGVCCFSCCVKTRLGGKRLSAAAIDREIAALTSSSGKLLEFKHINCRVNDRNTQSTKRILSDLSGFAQRGQVLGLLGPSGSGKTSLLNALAAVENGKCQLTGEVSVDGKKIGRAYRRIAAYVQQDDALFGTLTVRECLQYSAELRLPSSVPEIVKHEMVSRIVAELNLGHVEHARIGGSGGGASEGRGISGGERRRVSIGMELVTSPQILFLDEPTSGLDSSSANSVVQLVKELASHGRIVVMSIHQPSTKAFMLLDQVVLLAKGKMLYHDKPHKAKDHFETIGFKCPENENVADFILDIASNVQNIPMVRAAFKVKYGDVRTLTPSRAAMLSKLHTPEIAKMASGSYFSSHSHSVSSESSPFMDAEDTALDTPRIDAMLHGNMPGTPGTPETPGTPGTPAALSSPTSPPGLGSPERIHIHSTMSSNHRNGSSSVPTRSMWIELRVLFQRTALNIFRHRSLLVLHLALSVMLALFGGLIFNHVTNDLAGFQNRSGAFYFILTFFGFASMSSMDLFIAERSIFLRETGAMYYGALSYFIAKAVLDTVLLRMLPAAIFASIFYWIMGLQATFAHFVMFQTTLVLFNVAAGAISILVGVLSRNVGTANLTATVVFLVMLLFGGFLLNSQTMPKSVGWLKHFSIFSYAFEILMTNELKGLLLTFDAPGYPAVPVYGDVFLKTLGMDYANRFYDLAALAIIAAGLQVLAFLFLSLQVPVRLELVGEAENADDGESDSEKKPRRAPAESVEVELDDSFKLADLRKRAKTEDADEEAEAVKRGVGNADVV